MPYFRFWSSFPVLFMLHFVRGQPEKIFEKWIVCALYCFVPIVKVYILHSGLESLPSIVVSLASNTVYFCLYIQYVMSQTRCVSFPSYRLLCPHSFLSILMPLLANSLLVETLSGPLVYASLSILLYHISVLIAIAAANTLYSNIYSSIMSKDIVSLK